MPLTVHHLQVSQSERVTWLCEELDIPYTLTLHPHLLSAIHPRPEPARPSATACAEYIIQKYGGGKLGLGPSHKDYADYLYWFHFANGTLQPQVLLAMQLSRVDGAGPYTARAVERFKGLLAFMDGRLVKKTWLEGEEFTAADIMTVFSLTTMRVFYGFNLSEYTGILRYLEKVVQREGYKKARAKADPELELMIGGQGSAVVHGEAQGGGEVVDEMRRFHRCLSRSFARSRFKQPLGWHEKIWLPKKAQKKEEKSIMSTKSKYIYGATRLLAEACLDDADAHVDICELVI
ncbi:glutathione S-transferase [Mycena crocata]|nr:glutathione S-transferase [Mycena crocata]